MTLTAGRRAILDQVDEKTWMAQVREWARAAGWLEYHSHSSRRSPAGFPDLLLCRPPRVIFAELKSQHGSLTGQQAAWLAALRMCPQIEVFCWRPQDELVVLRTLGLRA